MSHPLVSVSQMRAWEAASWAAGVSASDVIATVGSKLAEMATEATRAGDTILLLAGRGHNGDDVRAAVPHLLNRRVQLLEVRNPVEELPVLALALAEKPSLVLDGLFGIGLNRPLDAAWCELVHCLNGSGVRVASVDVPSGLDAESGMPLGAAVGAAMTWTVGAPKVGLVVGNASDYVGRLEVLTDVGLIPMERALPSLGRANGRAGMEWVDGLEFVGYPGVRGITSHKGTYGHAVLVAGSMGYHGAAVLAARAAMRAQPGLITVMTPPEVYVPVASQLHAPMVRMWEEGSSYPEKATSILIGPGLAAEQIRERMVEEVRRLWTGSESAVVVDASGLDGVPKGPVKEGVIRVITPHPGEAARLLGLTVTEVQSKRVWVLGELSKRMGGCWVVLKGHQTLVGREGGVVGVNSSGNPTMAQGGAGDVLAGLIAGLLAQPWVRLDVEKVLRWAVWRHGVAADRLREKDPSWTIEDLAGVV